MRAVLQTGKADLGRTESTLVCRYPCGANPAGARCIASTTGRLQARLISGPAHAEWLAMIVWCRVLISV
jgi:hypothetical protein